MAECVICQNEQLRILIEADLRSHLTVSVIAVRHRVPKIMVINHTVHMAPEHPNDTAAVPTVPIIHDSWTVGLRASGGADNPLSQFKQAWQLAKDDPRTRQAMVSWLNDQLQSEDMGLP